VRSIVEVCASGRLAAQFRYVLIESNTGKARCNPRAEPRRCAYVRDPISTNSADLFLQAVAMLPRPKLQLRLHLVIKVAHDQLRHESLPRASVTVNVDQTHSFGNAAKLSAMNVIADFERLSAGQLRDAARILRDALAHMPSAYNGPGEAETEVRSFLDDPSRFALAALDGDRLLGWIGGIRENYSHAYELHPLVIDPQEQRRGIGSALVAALESKSRAEGAITLYLGTDDDFGGTNLFGRDLYPDVLSKAQQLSPTGAHASTFYRRLGFEVVGIIPDANGFGRPDILMAKRIG
jgi:aminoglycoside 6'-N-acetyltransferase I